MPYSGGLHRNIVQCLDDYRHPPEPEPHRRRHPRARSGWTGRDHRPGGRKPQTHPRHGGAHPLRHAAALRGPDPGERAVHGRLGVELAPVTSGACGQREPGDQHPRRLRLRQCAPCPRPGGLRLRGGSAGWQATPQPMSGGAAGWPSRRGKSP